MHKDRWSISTPRNVWANNNPTEEESGVRHSNWRITRCLLWKSLGPGSSEKRTGVLLPEGVAPAIYPVSERKKRAVNLLAPASPFGARVFDGSRGRFCIDADRWAAAPRNHPRAAAGKSWKYREPFNFVGISRWSPAGRVSFLTGTGTHGISNVRGIRGIHRCLLGPAPLGIVGEILYFITLW